MKLNLLRAYGTITLAEGNLAMVHRAYLKVYNCGTYPAVRKIATSSHGTKAKSAHDTHGMHAAHLRPRQHAKDNGVHAPLRSPQRFEKLCYGASNHYQQVFWLGGIDIELSIDGPICRQGRLMGGSVLPPYIDKFRR